MFTRQERAALAFVSTIAIIGSLAAWWSGNPRLEPAPRIETGPRVRVNAADTAELAALPGIGPVLARRIVAYRRRHGRFLTLTDLSRVPGIQRKTVAGLAKLVRFD